MLADLHTHTALCNHASGTPEEYLAAAERRNLAFLGVSDHFPAPAEYDERWRMKPSQLPEYERLVRGLQNASTMGVAVLYAAEFAYVPGRMDEVCAALDKESFAYRIGSVPYVDGFAFDDPDCIGGWDAFGRDRVWDRYLDLLREFVERHSFEILAHADLPKKFGFRPSRPDLVENRFEEIFRIAAKKGVCLELNTAGLRCPCAEIYPAPNLVRLARKAGMRISLASDAHKPSDVGRDFDRAIALAKDAGFASASVFCSRELIPLPFD